MTHSWARLVKLAACMILPVAAMLCASLVFAQTTGLSQLKTLRPESSDIFATAGLVALAGDTAVTAYPSTLSGAWQIWYRNVDANSISGWSEPQLLAEDSTSSTGLISMSADGNVVAIGLVDDATSIWSVRMYRSSAAGTEWHLESEVFPLQDDAPFGGQVRVRGDLLVAWNHGSPSSTHAFHFDRSKQEWVSAGWAIEGIPVTSLFSVATDGERIAYCMTRCTTWTRNQLGEWAVEAESDVISSGDDLWDVQVSGEWLIVDRHIYHRVDTKWVESQSISLVFRFALDHDALLVSHQLRGEEIWHNDGELWQPVSTLGRFSSQLALSGDRALLGIQSFLETPSDGWQASGSIEGIVNPDWFQFGSSIAIDDGALWVGIPGSNLVDFWSGAANAYRLGGPSVAPSQASLVAEGHLPRRRFGSAMVIEQDLMVVASDPSIERNASIQIFNKTTRQLLQEIIMADIDVRPRALALDGDTLVVGLYPRNPEFWAPGILVYRRQNSGPFEFVQEWLAQPEDSDTGFGERVVLHDGWLASGDVLLHRDESESEFAWVRKLEHPEGVQLAGWTLAADGGTLFVAPIESPKQFAFVYQFDEANGWILSGDIPRVPPFGENGGSCEAMSISGDTAACLLSDVDSISHLELLAIRREDDSPQWQATNVLAVDAPRPITQGMHDYQMISAGAYIALSMPTSGVGGPDDNGHSHGGRVIVFLTGEAIFDNGFE